MAPDGKGSLRVVVIGASAAGLRAAARAKRLMPDATVTVVDSEKIISYGACGLPYYLSGDIESPRHLRETQWGTIRDEAFFRQVKDLTVMTETKAEHVDADAKQVRITDLRTGKGEVLTYDRLVLATGASPIWLPGVAKDHPRITTFKTFQDAQQWRGRLERNELDRLAIVGAGFIGLELAEAFTALWGCEVDLIEAEDRVLPQMLDPEMARLVQDHLEEQGVRIHTSCCVESIENTEQGLRINTADKTLETQYAIFALGVRPTVELAEQAGVALGEKGGIAVDENLRTNLPDVYAAGDCIEVELVCGVKAVVPLGSLANKQGRAVGDNLAGRDTKFPKVAVSACVKAFDFNIASTGLTETLAKNIGLACHVAWGNFSGLAHYYPEDKSISLKLVYAADSKRLLGLQAVGEGDVVKRVDVMGNLLRIDGKLEDLLDLEFCYSPPYSPALDPLYVIGAVAANQEDGLSGISPDSDLESAFVIDVRSEPEAQANAVDGAINIPLEQFRQRVDEVPRDRDVVVICQRGARSAEVARILLWQGHRDVRYVGGGVAMKTR